MWEEKNVYLDYRVKDAPTYSLKDLMVPAHEVEEYIEEHCKNSDNHKPNIKERDNMLALIGILIKILGYDKTTV